MAKTFRNIDDMGVLYRIALVLEKSGGYQWLRDHGCPVPTQKYIVAWLLDTKKIILDKDQLEEAKYFLSHGYTELKYFCSDWYYCNTETGLAMVPMCSYLNLDKKKDYDVKLLIGNNYIYEEEGNEEQGKV